MKLFISSLKIICSMVSAQLTSRTFYKQAPLHFLKAIKQTESKWKCKFREYDHLQFTGMEISTVEDGIVIHKKSYGSKLKLPPKKQPLSEVWLHPSEADVAYKH